MADPRGPTSVAENLMTMALALLDQAGNDLAACQLQQALDTLRGEPPMRRGDELTPEQVATFDRMCPISETA